MKRRFMAVAAPVIACLAFGAFAAAQRPPAPPTPNEQMATVLAAHQKLQPKPVETLHPVRARQQPTISDAAIQVIQDKKDVAPDRLPPVGKVEMKTMPGPDGTTIPIRIYTPKGDGPFPLIVYYHGGGWVIASIDDYDASARGLCSLNDAVVVAVEYRQAPEHKFPAAHEDAYASFQYVVENAASFNGDFRRVAVAGESAGGNLAAAVCLMAKQRSGAMPVHQVLIYPVTDYAFDTESYRRNANAKPLSAAMMPWFFQQYLNSPADGTDVRISPLRCFLEDLRGLPPATVVTAEIDPLRSEGMAYARKLKEAGVDTASKDFEGVTHEFFGMSLLVDEAKAANAFVAGRLRAAFRK